MKKETARAWCARAGAALLLLGLLAGCGGGGGGGDTPVAVTPPVANKAPVPAIAMSGTVGAGAGSADISTFTNSSVTLDAGASTDPDGDKLSYAWTLVSKPAGSTLVLPGTAAQAAFKADIAGTYVASVRVTDSRGAYADKQVTILANTNAPVTTLSMSVSYSAVPTTLATKSVTLGAVILVDASASQDADGDPVTTTFDLIERPAASRASLTIVGKTARFVADAVGAYKIRARAADPSGAYSETVYPIEALGDAPQTVITSTVTNVTGDSGQNTVQASIGYLVALSGEGSRDPDGGALTHAWSLVSRPAGSTAALSVVNGAFSQFTPDLMGDYVVRLVATNPSGASSSYQTTVSVRNRPPQAVIGSNATPQALPTGPAVRLPVGTTLTLRGTSSTDADGDTLTYAWSFADKPANSTATLSSNSGATVQLTTDVEGSYQVRLRVTDTAGAWSERLLSINSGNTAPTAVIDKSRLSVLAGNAIGASASFSYDDDGDALSYSWAIDARPAGSVATIAAPNAVQLAFTPDTAGTYVASLTVSDGKNASVTYMTIKALSSVTSNVPLSFAPLQMRYSRGLDQFVAIATNPNALYIVDPFNGATRTVPLPLGVKSFNLSADGKLAAVLHEGIVSLVDIASATLVRSSLTGGSQTDAFPTNAGLIYLVGQSGGQWVDRSVWILNGRTGADLSNASGYYGGSYYGTMRGVFAASKNKGFVMSNGLSPSDISYFDVDPASGALVRTGDSPYHGDYAMNLPFYLSGNEDLLFTSSGTFFRTDTLQYAGRLSMNGPLLSMSHSAAADEALVLSNSYSPQGSYSFNGTVTYQASYQRFMGALFLPDTSIALPLVNGQQSYGINIFHSANDNHVTLVQTGSDQQNASGIRYYLVTR